MIELRHPYATVDYGGSRSVGGNQMRAQKKIMRQAGCGVVAAADLTLYLGAHRAGCGALARSALPLPFPEYETYLETLRRRYLPLIPRFGLNGLMLVWGLNRIFMKNRVPLRAGWGVRSGKLWPTVTHMLASDLPVILSVGPNLPRFWRRRKLTFYRKTETGELVPAAFVRAHYVTVTGLDDTHLRIASWGGEYFISRDEFTRYAARDSTRIFSNIVRLKPKRRLFG